MVCVEKYYSGLKQVIVHASLLEVVRIAANPDSDNVQQIAHVGWDAIQDVLEDAVIDAPRGRSKLRVGGPNRMQGLLVQMRVDRLRDLPQERIEGVPGLCRSRTGSSKIGRRWSTQNRIARMAEVTLNDRRLRNKD